MWEQITKALPMANIMIRTAMIKLLLMLLSIPFTGLVLNDNTGKGIEGVVVSDGYSCTVTDGQGRYCLNADSLARTVSVSIPSGFDIPMNTSGAPAFFKYIGNDNYDFHLAPRNKVENKFTLIAISDAHGTDGNSIDRFKKESLPDVQNTIHRHRKWGPVIGIALGDQVTDKMEYNAKVKPLYASLVHKGKTVPFFFCIGNHDHDNTGGKTEYAVTEQFVRNFCPTDYSFNIGKAHIVVMDDIQYTGTQRDGVKISYSCGITDKQLNWLRQDLDLVQDKEDKVLVFCIHAPFFGRFMHKEEVKALLGGFSEVHILSGHEHNINNIYHGGNIYEHNLQSIGGAWWFSNLSPSGCPLGYGVFSFDGQSLAESYNKATTEAPDFQMRVYSGSDSYGPHTPFSGIVPEEARRDKVYAWPENLNGHFIVRIWDGTPDWEVKFVQGGVETPMEQTEVKFFDACSAAYMVDVFGAPYGGSSIYKAMVDTFWTIPAPSGDPSAERDWEIVATHRMPSGKTVTYRSRTLMHDYRGFAVGTHYVR